MVEFVTVCVVLPLGCHTSDRRYQTKLPRLALVSQTNKLFRRSTDNALGACDGVLACVDSYCGEQASMTV